MVLFEKHEWGTELQRGLDRDSVATVEVCVGDDSFAGTQDASGLTFGPYGSSPITGLHFETADDTAAS
jgi:hypothetical protein